MYYCVIVAFCQHVLNEHAMQCKNFSYPHIFSFLCFPLFQSKRYHIDDTYFTHIAA